VQGNQAGIVVTKTQGIVECISLGVGCVGYVVRRVGGENGEENGKGKEIGQNGRAVWWP
jgi:hypothetical protein